MARILALDDDEEILMIIKRALEKEGHVVETKMRAEQVERERLKDYALILLDVMMPGEDGFAFCKEIRNIVDCPILFITAKTMENDLIEGLSIGADDYIKKPFRIAEVRARVQAHLRREVREKHTRMAVGNYFFDLSEKRMYLEERGIPLTKGEYAICEFLARNKGQVFSLDQLVERILGYDSESDCSAIREHVKNIRAKLKNMGENPIETVWGIGYKWIA
ncbi:MAG: two-component system, OmpR family, lantibiotic biosynthesis response regulator NisR/SpaR [Clostridiales bacterium]|nr:two-component system, OmpR family, lantibiotic biosynthesis response regulator NisR/SpaR [Clostridiales bacterium]